MCRPGKPLPASPTLCELGRFLLKVMFHPERPWEECWLWQGFCDDAGYGCFKWRGMRVFAHRFAYAMYCGELIEGMQIHHKCFHQACVNPRHLEQISHSENARMHR